MSSHGYHKVGMCGVSGQSLLPKCQRADHYHKATMSENRHDLSGDPLVCYFLSHILICTVTFFCNVGKYCGLTSLFTLACDVCMLAQISSVSLYSLFTK